MLYFTTYILYFGNLRVPAQKMVFIFMLHFFDNRKYVDTYQDLQTIFSFHYSWYFGCSSVVTNFTLHHPYLCRQFVFSFSLRIIMVSYFLSHAHNNNQTINIDLDISQKYFCNVCCKGSMIPRHYIICKPNVGLYKKPEAPSV